MMDTRPDHDRHPFASISYIVHCHICGWGWDEQDPEVRFIYADHVWECADEGECWDRRMMRTGGGNR